MPTVLSTPELLSDAAHHVQSVIAARICEYSCRGIHNTAEKRHLILGLYMRPSPREPQVV